MLFKWSVRHLVKAAPILRSISMRAETAFAWFSSRSTGLRAAWMTCLGVISSFAVHQTLSTHALSMLLKCARLTCNRRFTSRAMLRISAPIFSPSRSQSVHMNRISELRACRLMFSAKTFLSSSIFFSMGASKSSSGSLADHCL